MHIINKLTTAMSVMFVVYHSIGCRSPSNPCVRYETDVLVKIVDVVYSEPIHDWTHPRCIIVYRDGHYLLAQSKGGDLSPRTMRTFGQVSETLMQKLEKALSDGKTFSTIGGLPTYNYPVDRGTATPQVPSVIEEVVHEVTSLPKQ
jgi:hypothetical protein